MQPGSQQPRTAFVFFSHRFDGDIGARYERLKSAASGRGDAFIMAEAGTAVPDGWSGEAHLFNYPTLRKRSAKVIGDRVVPGNCHLPAIDFAEAHPGYDYYWFIEYDVVFTGDWGVLFDAASDDDADLLVTHARNQADENVWSWWRSIQAPVGAPSPALVRAFFPVYRISQRGVEAVATAVGAGWTGHFEGLLPTLIVAGGLRLSDIGGNGPYVPAGRHNRFYTSFSGYGGKLEALGTMRWRPPHFGPLLVRNYIYHPVKPRRPTVADVRLGMTAVRHIARDPVEVAQYAAQTATAFGRSRVGRHSVRTEPQARGAVMRMFARSPRANSARHVGSPPEAAGLAEARAARAFPPPCVSVVIPAFNPGELLADQLTALCTQTWEGRLEVVVADNGSTDGTRELVKRIAGDNRATAEIRVVDASAGKGVNVARNTGWAAASAAVILICDADDVAAPDWVASMVHALRDNDLVGGVCVYTEINPASVYRWQTTKTSKGVHTAAKFLPYAIGANFGAWREVIESVDGWDERFQGGADDIDFSWRAQLAGWRLGSSDAVVHYRLRADLRSAIRQRTTKGAMAALLYSVHRDHIGRRTLKSQLTGAYRLVRALPELVSIDGRRRWLLDAAAEGGRIRGSIRHRVFYL